MEVELLSKYIASWSWFLISIIFLNSMLLVIVLGDGTGKVIIAASLFMLFFFSAFMAMKRQEEL